MLSFAPENCVYINPKRRKNFLPHLREDYSQVHFTSSELELEIVVFEDTIGKFIIWGKKKLYSDNSIRKVWYYMQGVIFFLGWYSFFVFPQTLMWFLFDCFCVWKYLLCIISYDAICFNLYLINYNNFLCFCCVWIWLDQIIMITYYFNIPAFPINKNNTNIFILYYVSQLVICRF